MNELTAAEQHQRQEIERSAQRAIKELSERLVVLGDVHELALEVGDKAAGEAMHFLTERAPSDIAGAWPLVIAWHRLNESYRQAHALGDREGQRKAATEQLKIVTDRYN